MAEVHCQQKTTTKNLTHYKYFHQGLLCIVYTNINATIACHTDIQHINLAKINS